MTDENDADVHRALAALGGTTMKYLNFASPLLKRAARTRSLTLPEPEPSYEPLFKREPSVAPEISPVPASPQCEPPPVTTASPAPIANDAVVFLHDEPEVEIRPAAGAESTDLADGIVAPESLPGQPIEPSSLSDAAEVAALHTSDIAYGQSAPPPLRIEPSSLSDAAATPASHTSVVIAPGQSATLLPLAHEVSDASGPSTTANLAPFTSLADHMARVFGSGPARQPADPPVQPKPAADRTETSAPDRRTVAEMFRILSGRVEDTVEVAQWRDVDQSLFRRL